VICLPITKIRATGYFEKDSLSKKIPVIKGGYTDLSNCRVIIGFDKAGSRDRHTSGRHSSRTGKRIQGI